MAKTGWPLQVNLLAANAGAMIFTQGGNAVDAACAMLAASCTMWDVLSWGGETQAIIYNPKTKKVIAINALGVAPTGATVDFFKSKGYELSSGIWTACCGYSRYAWWSMLYAGRIWNHESERSACTCYANGRWLSDGRRNGKQH